LVALLCTFSARTSVLPAAAYAATGGGGIGTTPPPPPNPDFANTLDVRGVVSGYPNGPVSLIFRLVNESTSLFALNQTLFEETNTVSVQNGVFSLRLGGATAGGIPSSLVAGRARLYVAWFSPAAPTVSLGSLALASTAYALTLAPGATVAGTGSTPALTVTNSGPAVLGEASGSTGRGLTGVASSVSGVAYGVEGRSASPAGAGGNFVNTGGGDLLHGRNVDGGPVVFRVANDGKIFVNGMQVGLQGPQGDKGAPGTPGLPGDPGAKGDPATSGSIATYCIVTPGNCFNKCQNGSVLLAEAVVSGNSPCYVTSSAGPCSSGDSSSACCVCTGTH
jgi:hypothetical protein